MAVKKYNDPLTHRTKLYSVWCAMRQRCNNPKNKDYKWYGGKGVLVCEEWNDFKIFQEWALLNGYEEGLTIDRKNGDMNYSPENCRWITISEQQRNRKGLHLIAYNGETHCMQEWAEICGISRGAIRDRLKKGWTVEETLTTPIQRNRGGIRWAVSKKAGRV